MLIGFADFDKVKFDKNKTESHYQVPNHLEK